MRLVEDNGEIKKKFKKIVALLIMDKNITNMYTLYGIFPGISLDAI